MTNVESLLTRGVERIYPSREFLKSFLLSGKKLTVYHGVDPTGSSLHIGHAIPLRKLGEFQTLGHKVIFLIGDFTAAIGDPTGKMSVRTPLSREQILENTKLYKQQASHFVRFDGDNPAGMRYNSEWLAKLSFSDALSLASHMTHAQIIKRDMFEKRIAEGKDLFLHEFLYPLMQGYDSVAMDIDGEIGGSDQIFNMLVGRDLLKKIKGKEKFVLATKLLLDSKGVKMGKTEGNMVAVSDEPDEMFGKIMSWNDNMIQSGLELCTNIPEQEFPSILSMHPMEAKLALAERIVEEIHGKQIASDSREHFISTFHGREVPENVVEIICAGGEGISDALVRTGILKSKSEFTRLERAGGIHLLVNNIVKIGRHRFVRIKRTD